MPAPCPLTEKPSQTTDCLPLAGKPTTTAISLLSDDDIPADETTLLQRENLARRRAHYAPRPVPPGSIGAAMPEPTWTCVSCERRGVPRLQYVCAPCRDATAGVAQYPTWMRRAANVDTDWVCCNCGSGESRWVHSCSYCKIHSRCPHCVAAPGPGK